ncbi:peptidylprolyl isomerase [Allostreptomyces psammosilenae]|uniref:Peptidyl-prolyl cis-trans isomerase B (Cyclophilin B) n=1 Tax=Allostreptomyces psammosilenae TaxID=1892865 RepID=A0A852ZT53_9ACTN|nr:peptidylprolyl isomerase [Allostreptomyces psammosilenae]NYI05015.1 peptidyl-prolyl cis-trans isomerase B (cyclophilin B) [Allostreptomyces psammosilenae]
MVSNKEKRRRELARQRHLRQLERQREAAAKRRRRNRITALTVAGVLVLAGGAWTTVELVGGDDDSSQDTAADTASPSPSASASTVATPIEGCTEPTDATPNGATFDAEPAMEIDESATYTMTLATNCGDITVEMDASKAPHTVNSFAFLAGEDYFDNSVCHRVTSGTLNVLQCGDPTGQGTGGPGYTIPDENLDDPAVEGETYPAGTVAMANTGQPDSGGSQFFIVYEDSQLPASYTPFGTVTSGLDRVAAVAAAGVQGGGQDGAPVQGVQLTDVTVAPKES